MRRFALAVLKRLLASIAILVFMIVFGYLYGLLVGPSKIAYSGTIMLIAWPWALPQVFVAVSVVWFLAQRLKRFRPGSIKGDVKREHFFLRRRAG
jgi:hypothetical protein